MHSGRPFNRCTHIALCPDSGAIYVADGYGNSCVHKYDPNGKLLFSWGEAGTDPGQFNIVHNICTDKEGYVYVADRENHRVQVFDRNGKYETSWSNVHRPCGLFMDNGDDELCYIGELGSGMAVNATHPNLGPRIAIHNRQGEALARLGDDSQGAGEGPAQFLGAARRGGGFARRHLRRRGVVDQHRPAPGPTARDADAAQADQTRLAPDKETTDMPLNAQVRDRIAVVASQTALMAQAYGEWPEADWQRDTFCAGWTAADAVAHLVTGADFYTQVIESGRTGKPGKPWGVTNVEEFRVTRGDAGKKLTAAGSAAVRQAFSDSGAALQAVLESLQDRELSELAWHPRGLVPIEGWIGMRIIELGIHDWDIRQPHEPDAGLSPAVLPALLAVLPDMQAQFLTQRAGDLVGTFGFQAVDASWGIRLHEGTASYLPETPSDSDACLYADAESMILLTMGRANLTAKQASGALTVTGDADKGQQLCATLFRAF